MHTFMVRSTTRVAGSPTTARRNDPFGQRTPGEFFPQVESISIHINYGSAEKSRRNGCSVVVADDVGLGKTIEAGLILETHQFGLNSATPHSLSGFTGASMAGTAFHMFDIRTAQYNLTKMGVVWISGNSILSRCLFSHASRGSGRTS